jgi:citrate lyase subunit beta/citryl-CoA lyase
MDFMRSWMFVPGNSLRFIDKVFTLKNLDVAMFDIEDGVIPSHKAVAREQIVSALKKERPAGAPTIFVRINAVGTGPDRIDADLSTVIVSGLEGLIIPKVEDPADVHLVEAFLDKREKQVGIKPGYIKLVAAIESAKGLIKGPAIAASSPRLIGLLFGAEDYALDLSLPSHRVAEARELLYARANIVNAAASANIASIDGVWPDIQDLEGCERDAIQARRLGFTGKSTFHPGQIDLINKAFTPSDAEVDYASRVVAAFDAAVARGDGAVAFGGQLLDLPIIERAKRVLRIHETLAAGVSKE